MPEEMSKKQAVVFEKVVKSAIVAEEVFQKTGTREQFIAVQDQIDSYKKKFNSKLKIEFEGLELS